MLDKQNIPVSLAKLISSLYEVYKPYRMFYCNSFSIYDLMYFQIL